jgi:hypothetical protein
MNTLNRLAGLYLLVFVIGISGCDKQPINSVDQVAQNNDVVQQPNIAPAIEVVDAPAIIAAPLPVSLPAPVPIPVPMPLPVPVGGGGSFGHGGGGHGGHHDDDCANACDFDINCEDDNPCTEDRCVKNECSYIEISGCAFCNIAAECLPGPTCTTTTCLNNVCSYPIEAGCAYPIAFEIIPSAATIIVGGSQQFLASAQLSDGSIIDVTELSFWSSFDPAIASVSNIAGSRGLATGLSPGLASVGATWLGFSDSALLEVTAVLGTFTLGGTVSGLLDGTTLILLNNGSDAEAITTNGIYTFAQSYPNFSFYNVTVGTQPAGQICSVANNLGMINGANVTNINVTCVDLAETFTLGGVVSGLGFGATIILRNNDNGEIKQITANGVYAFDSLYDDLSAYEVVIFEQPVGQTCEISNGTGVINGADVTNINVSCVDNPGEFTLGGTISGLAPGGELLVVNTESIEFVNITANGPYIFEAAYPAGTTYDVEIFTQPDGQFCVVENRTGTITVASINNVNITCTQAFDIGGTVSGLVAGGTLVLTDANTSAQVEISTNGSYTFGTNFADGSNYLITATTTPISQTCVVSNGAGTINGADITDVNVVCANAPGIFSIGGTVSGLPDGGILLLENEDGGAFKEITANGPYIFDVGYTDLALYQVAVVSEPAGYDCLIANGSGSINGANVSNIDVTCTLLQGF